MAWCRMAETPAPVSVEFLYSLIGEARLAALVAAFYQRVAVDDLIGPMYPPEDLAGAEKRLRDFLVMRFGGPQTYMHERGHPRLRMRHAPFAIGVAERDRWLELMDEAITEVAIPENCVPSLRSFFRQVADFMQNR